MALAALRATREAEARSAASGCRASSACRCRASGWAQVVRRPRGGGRVPGRPARGPGEPADPAAAAAARQRPFPALPAAAGQPRGPSGEEPALPHIRLDRAIEFLLGDRLA